MTYEFTDRMAVATTFKMDLCEYRHRGEPRYIALWDGSRDQATIHMDLSEALRMATALLDLVDQSKSEANLDF